MTLKPNLDITKLLPVCKHKVSTWRISQVTHRQTHKRKQRCQVNVIRSYCCYESDGTHDDTS